MYRATGCWCVTSNSILLQQLLLTSTLWRKYSLAKALVSVTSFNGSEDTINNHLLACNFYSPTPWDVKSSYITSVKNLLHFALLHFVSKSCYILRQKLLHFMLMLHFASIVTFCGVTSTTSELGLTAMIYLVVTFLCPNCAITFYFSPLTLIVKWHSVLNVGSFWFCLYFTILHSASELLRYGLMLPRNRRYVHSYTTQDSPPGKTYIN